jgi:hypothetical protein
MQKLTRESIRQLIQQEMKSLLSDDAVFRHKTIPGMLHNNDDCDDHKSSSYMAKKQLAKIAQYAQELYDMIDDNQQLDDWKESHIAQIADDIEEVYGSIRFDDHG